MGCHCLLHRGKLRLPKTLHHVTWSDPGIEPVSLMSPALAGGFFTTSATWEAPSKPEPYEAGIYFAHHEEEAGLNMKLR